MHNGARCVQELRLIEEQKAAGDDPHFRIVQRRDETLQRARRGNRVGVEEDQRVARRDLRPEVATARKPEVRRWADERYPPGRLDGIELVPAASVVDDDDLPVGPVGPDRSNTGEQAWA